MLPGSPNGHPAGPAPARGSRTPIPRGHTVILVARRPIVDRCAGFAFACPMGGPRPRNCRIPSFHAKFELSTVPRGTTTRGSILALMPPECEKIMPDGVNGQHGGEIGVRPRPRSNNDTAARMATVEPADLVSMAVKEGPFLASRRETGSRLVAEWAQNATDSLAGALFRASIGWGRRSFSQL
jgi:hypothetical protein